MQYKFKCTFRLIFEMLCLWPERSTFKSLKPINFPLYKEIIKDPIALDPIIERLDMNSLDQVKPLVYGVLCCSDLCTF